jgi:hypothetical protein
MAVLSACRFHLCASSPKPLILCCSVCEGCSDLPWLAADDRMGHRVLPASAISKPVMTQLLSGFYQREILLLEG